jgi:nitrogen fixation protein FixH
VKASVLWPGIILGFLGMNVTIVGITIAVTRIDSGYRVEQGYDVKALHWDEHKAALATQSSLGWQASCEVMNASVKSATLVIGLHDREKMPIRDGVVTINAFHASRPNHSQSVTAALVDGMCEASFTPDREGKWVFTVTIKHGGENFAETFEREVWFPDTRRENSGTVSSETQQQSLSAPDTSRNTIAGTHP